MTALAALTALVLATAFGGWLLNALWSLDENPRSHESDDWKEGLDD